MNVAFLFNSDHPSLGGWYGGSLLELILGSGVLQPIDTCGVSVGDVLTFSAASDSSTPTRAYHEKLCRQVYVPRGYERLDGQVIESLLKKATRRSPVRAVQRSDSRNAVQA